MAAERVMRVSVVVSTYQRRELVLRTVSSLLRQDYPVDQTEIIVVIDGSTDGTAEALRALPGSERLHLVEQENRGLAGARNSGLRVATGELILFLDDDMLCEQGLLRAHVEAHSGVTNVVGLGAIYVAPESRNRLAADYFEVTLGAPYLYMRNSPGESWPTEDWSFGNTSIRREVLDRVGGFDENFRMREDSELGVRLSEFNVERRFVRNAVAYQTCDKSARDLATDAERFAEADLQLSRKHPGRVHFSFVERIQREPKWKRAIRGFLARHLRLADALLVPFCALGESLHSVPLPRALGGKALQVRCGLHWYGRLLQLTDSNPQLR
ncbi:MAG TPA: glycosyltransferase family 2 protein [Terriglobales bacterium]